MASQPPMFASPSFLADIVIPSARDAISRTMSGMGLEPYRLAGSDEPRVLRKAARVEEQRQAVSVADGTDLGRLAIDTGWPPPELLVTVTKTTGMASRPRSAMRPSSAAASMFPLNGWIVAGWRPSAMGRSTASAPVNSTLARVVSKWVLFGTALPGPATTLNRIFSAARPWWVGITWRNGNSSWTASRKRNHDGLPA